MSLSVDKEKNVSIREKKSHLISYHSQNSEKKTFPQKRFQEQTLGGSPVQPLLRITGRPGQIHNTGSRTSHQTDGINMEKNRTTKQNKKTDQGDR